MAAEPGRQINQSKKKFLEKDFKREMARANLYCFSMVVWRAETPLHLLTYRSNYETKVRLDWEIIQEVRLHTSIQVV